MNNNILTRGFWDDEAWTAIISKLPVPELIKTTAADFHPPLYYLLVHLWINLFGDSEIAIRSLSLVFYLLTALFIYLFAKRITKSPLYSFITLIFVLMNPMLFLYAFEARNYSLFLFLSLLSMYSFSHLALSRSPISNFGFRISGPTYVLATLAGLYTHYYFFFLLAAQATFIFVTSTYPRLKSAGTNINQSFLQKELGEQRKEAPLRLRARGGFSFLQLLTPTVAPSTSRLGEIGRKLLKRFTTYWLLITLYYLPWLPFFFSQTSTVASGYWIGPLTSRTHLEIMQRLIAGEHQTFLTQPLVIIFTSLTTLFVVKSIRDKGLKTLNEWLKLFILWLSLPIILPTIISFYRPLFFYRYLIPLAAPLFLGFALLAHSFTQNRRFSYLSLLIILSLSLLINFGAFTQRTAPLMRITLEEVYKQAQINDVIVTILPSFAEVTYYNEQTAKKLHRQPLPILVKPEGLEQVSGKALLDTLVRRGELEIAQAPQKQRFFLITPGPSLELVKPE